RKFQEKAIEQSVDEIATEPPRAPLLISERLVGDDEEVAVARCGCILKEALTTVRTSLASRETLEAGGIL
ncbi:hypothetical protein ALC62_04569, partial [Cyphomyrmex costatus]